MTFGGLAAYTIIKPKPGLQPKPFGEGDVEHDKICGANVSSPYMRLLIDASRSISDLGHIPGRFTTNGVLSVGTIIKAKLGFQPKLISKNKEQQDTQSFAASMETMFAKICSANDNGDEPVEMIAHGKNENMNENAENYAFQCEDHVTGGNAVTVTCRNCPKQFMHYQKEEGKIALPNLSFNRNVINDNWWPPPKRLFNENHTEVEAEEGKIALPNLLFDRNFTNDNWWPPPARMFKGTTCTNMNIDNHNDFMPQGGAANGPCYHLTCEDMKETTPNFPGGLNALRLPTILGKAGSNVNQAAGEGANGHNHAGGVRSLCANDTAYEPADMNRTL